MAAFPTLMLISITVCCFISMNLMYRYFNYNEQESVASHYVNINYYNSNINNTVLNHTNKTYSYCEKLPQYLQRFTTKKLVIQNKDKILLLASIFAVFAEKYNIPWRLCQGSQLGAIRHHDFIPWDDDFDISIPNEYYKVAIIKLISFIKSNFNGVLNVSESHAHHGIIRLFYSYPQNKKLYGSHSFEWPSLDIFYPLNYYSKTDPIQWSTISYSKYLKGEQQSYVNIEDFDNFRYVFLYHESIDFANKLIFKVYYKIRHYEQHRLNTTVTHFREHFTNSKVHNWNSTAETVKDMKKYFNFVEYKYINKTYEIEILRLCNSNIILQRVEYKRDYVYINDNKIICTETATRYRDNTIYTLKSQFNLQNINDCFFEQGLI
eukprot:525224_1